MSSTYLILLFTSATAQYQLPVGLLSALCFVESTHRSHVVHKDDGNGNSVGLCQVKLATAQMLGFQGTEKQLMEPATNIEYSAKYLAKQLTRYSGDVSKAVPAYNAGRYKEGVNGKAKNWRYSEKVFKAWSERR